MTEQEIVDVLKENKTKGVAYLFMPEEVRDWVHDKLFDKILLVLDSMGNFIPFQDVEEGLINTEDYDNVVFALSDDYQVKKESEGEWVEFEINQRGQFLVIFPQSLRCYFNWFQWWRLLEKSIDYNCGYTAFGGWQYEDDGTWFTTPQLFAQECFTTMVDYDEICKPAIPKRIRFWRESR